MIIGCTETIIGTILIMISLFKDVSILIPMCGIVVLFLGLYKIVDTFLKKEEK